MYAKIMQKRRASINQNGINMVDLMMWLVIAALLLAAALQSIDYYRKAALIYQLSADAMGAGQNIAAASQKGVTTDASAQEGLAATKVSDADTVLSKSVGQTGHYIVISSNPELPGYDVVYSSETKDGLNAGVNVVPKGAPGYSGIMLPERGTPIGGKCAAGQWKAEFFNNADLSGTPAATLCESKIYYAWQQEGPGVEGVGRDYFSIRWTSTFNAPTTKTYNFNMQSDDGSRIKLDGTTIAGTFGNIATMYNTSKEVTAGDHELVVEYHEIGGYAAAYFNYGPA